MSFFGEKERKCKKILWSYFALAALPAAGSGQALSVTVYPQAYVYQEVWACGHAYAYTLSDTLPEEACRQRRVLPMMEQWYLLSVA